MPAARQVEAISTTLPLRPRALCYSEAAQSQHLSATYSAPPRNRKTRESADAALNAKLACGRKVLAAVSSEDDARWLDFRADVPADLDRPEQVERVQWQPGAPGRITVSWRAATRAERYVVQVFVEGQDTAFRNVATVQDTNADISVTPGRR